MNYLTKNIKGIGLLTFLLVVLIGVNQVILQKEEILKDRVQLAHTTIVMNIEQSCLVTGKLIINGVTYTCIPRDAM